MSLTKKDVEYAAKLAHLYLSEEEKEKFTGQLTKILEYMDKLNQLDVSGVEPMSHPLALNNVWREDRAVSEDLKKEILGNAPEVWNDYFKVKKVIE